MKSSYQFEKLEGRMKEATFLAERASLRLDGFPALLARHGLPKEGRILEVGCGQGIRTRILAWEAPRAQVVGVDRASELLDLARAEPTEGGFANLAFQEADLYTLPYPEASFDFVYARLVFMHLSDPTRALESLRRVLKPGGRILLEDADRDCMFFEPAPRSFAVFWKRVQEAQRRLGGDPNVGRRLAPYLKDAGFQDLRVEPQPIVGNGEDIRFLARTLMPSLNLYLPPRYRREGQTAIRDLERLADDPSATFFHFWFAVSGAKA